jgi:hypothetical protein
MYDSRRYTIEQIADTIGVSPDHCVLTSQRRADPDPELTEGRLPGRYLSVPRREP